MKNDTISVGVTKLINLLIFKHKCKKIYKIYRLTFGVSAVITLTYFLIRFPFSCIAPFEPNPFIRIPEIIIGLSILPYYIKELYRGMK